MMVISNNMKTRKFPISGRTGNDNNKMSDRRRVISIVKSLVSFLYILL